MTHKRQWSCDNPNGDGCDGEHATLRERCDQVLREILDTGTTKERVALFESFALEIRDEAKKELIKQIVKECGCETGWIETTESDLVAFVEEERDK